jgi:hypothetical protein
MYVQVQARAACMVEVTYLDNLKVKGLLQDLVVDGEMMRKYILRKWGERMWTNSVSQNRDR